MKINFDYDICSWWKMTTFELGTYPQGRLKQSFYHKNTFFLFNVKKSENILINTVIVHFVF